MAPPYVSKLTLATFVVLASCLTVSAIHRHAEFGYSAFLDVEDDGVPDYNWPGWGFGPPCPRRGYATYDDRVTKDDADVSKALDLINQDMLDYIQLLKNKFGWNLGTTFGVVYGDKVWMSKGYGVKNKDGSEPPDSNTVFNIGSVTKIFTSLMMMQAVDRKVATLDDTISQYFNDKSPPAFHMRNVYGSRPAEEVVTMHALATHTSGLPREAPCGLFPNVQCTIETNFHYLKNMSLYFSPFTHPHYSNLGSALLGRCMERAFNDVYESHVVNEILRPIGMGSSGFDFTPDIVARQATGYTVVNGKLVVAAADTMPQYFSAPAGGMYSTLSDLLKYMQFVLNANNDNVLSKERLREYQLPGYLNSDGISSFGLSTFEVAYSNRYVVLTKGGLVDGFGANIAFIPALRIGVAMTINLGSGDPGVYTAKAINHLVPAINAAMKRVQTTPRLPPNYEEFLGLYGPRTSLLVYLQLKNGTRPGVLEGGLIGLPNLEFVWDPKQDWGNYTAFRYSDPSKTLSCTSRESTGSGGIVMFQRDSTNRMTATATDYNMNVWNLRKF